MKIAIFEIEPGERQAFEGLGGHPPLGYDIRDRKLVVNPAEAELVRLMFRRFLDP